MTLLSLVLRVETDASSESNVGLNNGVTVVVVLLDVVVGVGAT